MPKQSLAIKVQFPIDMIIVNQGCNSLYRMTRGTEVVCKKCGKKFTVNSKTAFLNHHNGETYVTCNNIVGEDEDGRPVICGKKLNVFHYMRKELRVMVNA